MIHAIRIGKYETEHYYVETSLSADDLVALAQIGNTYVKWLFSVDSITAMADDITFSTPSVFAYWYDFFAYADDADEHPTVAREDRWCMLNPTTARTLIVAMREEEAESAALYGGDRSWLLAGIDRFEAEARRRGLLDEQ